LLRDRQSNLERMKSLSDDEKEVYKDSLNDSDRQIYRMAKLLTEEVRRRIPVFDEVVESLGISGDNYVRAKAALAELMPHIIDFKSYHRLRRYLGLFKGNKRNKQVLQQKR